MDAVDMEHVERMINAHAILTLMVKPHGLSLIALVEHARYILPGLEWYKILMTPIHLLNAQTKAYVIVNLVTVNASKITRVLLANELSALTHVAMLGYASLRIN